MNTYGDVLEGGTMFVKKKDECLTLSKLLERWHCIILEELEKVLNSPRWTPFDKKGMIYRPPLQVYVICEPLSGRTPEDGTLILKPFEENHLVVVNSYKLENSSAFFDTNEFPEPGLYFCRKNGDGSNNYTVLEKLPAQNCDNIESSRYYVLQEDVERIEREHPEYLGDFAYLAAEAAPAKEPFAPPSSKSSPLAQEDNAAESIDSPDNLDADDTLPPKQKLDALLTSLSKVPQHARKDSYLKILSALLKKTEKNHDPAGRDITSIIMRCVDDDGDYLNDKTARAVLREVANYREVRSRINIPSKKST